jgi:hypothetical protein
VETGTCSHDPSHTTTRTGAAALGHDWGEWLLTATVLSLIGNEQKRDCSHATHPETRTVTLVEYLTTQNGVADDRVILPMNMDLGTMTAADSGWRQLLDAVNTVGKFVDLDLSDCTMSGTEYNPGSANTGEKMIVSLVLPNTAKSIIEGETWTNSAFKYFSGLKEVTGLNVSNIGSFAFYPSANLVKVSFPTVTEIGSRSFEGCTSLTEVSFPKALNIDSRAFEGCIKLTEISFPAVTKIETDAFEGCTSLADANFPLVINIETKAFYGCTNLKEISFPTADSIGFQAFMNCTNLTKASFPIVTEIGMNAFQGCASLTEIKFPATTNIERDAFSGCRSLINFEIIGTGLLSVIENGKVLVRNNVTLISYPSASGNIVLNTIIQIGNTAFSGCSNLTGVNLPLTTSIGNDAFANCSSLVEVNIPEATSILMRGFLGCTSLTKVSFPELTYISDWAFYGCNNLNKITLGTIIEANFSTYYTFPGNLSDVYLGVDGGAGTYTRDLQSTTPDNWVKAF